MQDRPASGFTSRSGRLWLGRRGVPRRRSEPIPSITATEVPVMGGACFPRYRHAQPMPRTSCATAHSVASHSLAHGQDETLGRRRTRIVDACVLTCHCSLMKHDAAHAAQSCPCQDLRSAFLQSFHLCRIGPSEILRHCSIVSPFHTRACVGVFRLSGPSCGIPGIMASQPCEGVWHPAK
jgi:hypothetical protein